MKMEDLEQSWAGGDNIGSWGEELVIVEVIDEITTPHVNPPLTNPFGHVLVLVRPFDFETFSLFSHHMFSESNASTMGDVRPYPRVF